MFKLVVLSCFLAAASAGFISPLIYSAPLWQPSNYRGPWSLAPGQPANILASDGRPLDTLDVNLDRAAHYNSKALVTGFHLLKKRSVAIVAPYAAQPILPYVAPITPYGYSAFGYSAPLYQPYNYRGPLSLAPGQPADILGSDGRPLDTLDVNLDRSAHLTAKALSGAHILKKRSAPILTPLIAPVSTVVARTPLIAPTYAYPSTYSTYINQISYATPLAHYL